MFAAGTVRRDGDEAPPAPAPAAPMAPVAGAVHRLLGLADGDALALAVPVVPMLPAPAMRATASILS